jgi:hypothetical protein
MQKGWITLSSASTTPRLLLRQCRSQLRVFYTFCMDLSQHMDMTSRGDSRCQDESRLCGLHAGSLQDTTGAVHCSWQREMCQHEHAYSTGAQTHTAQELSMHRAQHEAAAVRTGCEAAAASSAPSVPTRCKQRTESSSSSS